MKTTTKIIFCVFLLVLLTLTSCREAPTSKPPAKPELSINIPLNEVTIDYLLNNGWELAFKRKLYYPVQQDSGMMFQFMPKDRQYNWSFFTFHICNGDTIGIHYMGREWVTIKDPMTKGINLSPKHGLKEKEVQNEQN